MSPSSLWTQPVRLTPFCWILFISKRLKIPLFSAGQPYATFMSTRWFLGCCSHLFFFATWREQCREEKGEKKNTHSRDISTTGKGLTKEWVNTSCSKGPPCVVIASCNFTSDSGCLPAVTFRQQNVQRKDLWHSFRDMFLATWRPRLGLNELIICFVAKLLSWV